MKTFWTVQYSVLGRHMEAFLIHGFQASKCFLVLSYCQETSKCLAKVSLLFKLSMLLLLESFCIVLKKSSPAIHVSLSNVCKFVICSRCFAKLLTLLN